MPAGTLPGSADPMNAGAWVAGPPTPKLRRIVAPVSSYWLRSAFIGAPRPMLVKSICAVVWPCVTAAAAHVAAKMVRRRMRMLFLLMVVTIVVCPLEQDLYHTAGVSKTAVAIRNGSAFIFTVFAPFIAARALFSGR